MQVTQGRKVCAMFARSGILAAYGHQSAQADTLEAGVQKITNKSQHGIGGQAELVRVIGNIDLQQYLQDMQQLGLGQCCLIKWEQCMSW